MREIRKLMLSLAAGLALGALGPWVAGATAPRHPVELDGHDWARMPPAAREAYLSGFIAGAAAQQATGGDARRTAERVAAEALRLRRSGGLTFPLRENVYRSHVDDYYFYQNRRDQTLIRAIVEGNLQVRGGG